MTDPKLTTIAIVVQCVWISIMAAAITKLLRDVQRLKREMQTLLRWVIELDEARTPWRDRR